LFSLFFIKLVLLGVNYAVLLICALFNNATAILITLFTVR
jgi:hypothetical protein